jgi:hypothetical protein
LRKLTDVNYQTSEQHKEMGKARTEHDHKDTSTFLEFLKERNPFTPGTNLRNIETKPLPRVKPPMDLMLLISACSITKAVDKPDQNRSLRLTT